MILTLFFTRGISLEKWVRSGLFMREKAVYESLIRDKTLDKVYWITYGAADRPLSENLKSDGRLSEAVTVLQKPGLFKGKIGDIVYSLLIPFIHGGVLRGSGLLKCNQIDGSWAALISKYLFRKPFILRCGFLLSMFRKAQKSPALKNMIYACYEKAAFKSADICEVASDRDREYVVKEYCVEDEKIKTVPNYIDTSVFRPVRSSKFDGRLVYIGRLTLQKNLKALIRAAARLDMTLDIYGDGEEKSELLSEAEKFKADVNFVDVVPNDSLPEVLNRYRYFVIPSLYEGNPKTLLEAMACGLICIGTDVPGINDIIVDGENGFLSDSVHYDGIADAIARAIDGSNADMRENAVSRIRDNFSLNNILLKEKGIMAEIARRAVR